MNKYIICAFAFVFTMSVVGTAHAGTAKLSGWSANTGPYSSTIGWVSFDSNDIGTDGGTGRSSVPYGVTVSTTTGSNVGTFGGYAWSSNIGWISFNAGDVSSACGSQGTVDLTTGLVNGWARVLSGTPASGADGCISLSGTARNGGSYGVRMSPTTGVFSGYSWGDVNVGWLTFAGLICPGCANTAAQTITATCSASPNPVASGGMVTFTANTTEGTSPYHWSASSGITTASTGHSETSTVTNYISNSNPPTFTVTDRDSKTGTVLCDAPTIDTAINTYILNVTIAGSGSGYVSDGTKSCGSGTCTQEINVGRTVNLSGTPGSGSSFTGWSGGTCLGTASCSVGATAAAGDIINVTATFGGVGAATSQSHLWFGSRTRPNDASMANQLPVTISSGNSVIIKYDWDSSSIAGCNGGQASGSAMPANWSSPLSLSSGPSDPVSLRPFGTVTLNLTDAHIGTHILRLGCNSNNSPSVASYSANTIKLIVTKSIINEN